MCCVGIPLVVMIGILVSMVASRRTLRGIASPDELPSGKEIDRRACALGLRTGLYTTLVMLVMSAIPLLILPQTEDDILEGPYAVLMFAIIAVGSGFVAGMIAVLNYWARVEKGMRAVRRTNDEAPH